MANYFHTLSIFVFFLLNKKLQEKFMKIYYVSFIHFHCRLLILISLPISVVSSFTSTSFSREFPFLQFLYERQTINFQYRKMYKSNICRKLEKFAWNMINWKIQKKGKICTNITRKISTIEGRKWKHIKRSISWSVLISLK